jgi:uncharacterized protein (DUF934 family)
MEFISADKDAWTPVADTAACASPASALRTLLSWAQWSELRANWPAGVPVAVALPNDADVEALAEDLPRIALVVLHFPKWTDGRAYSQARLLRSRYRYAGQVRATGDVVVDMAPLLSRTGFDSAVLRDGQDPELARRALGFFPAYYQGDVHQRQPIFQRSEERGG